MKKLTLIYGLVFLMLFGLFYSCSDDNNDAEINVKYELRASMTINEIKLYMQLAGLSDLGNEIKYGVDIYYLEHPLEYLGNQITVSGLVCVPQEEGSTFPVLSFQHGTMVSKMEAPSLTYTGFLTKAIAAMAGAGYVVSIPDLVGFGASSDYFHPYFYKKGNAEAALEMVNVISEIPEGDLSGVTIGNDLYLSGYSQGGWITMAALEAIEKATFQMDNWNVVGAVCGAGPYDPELVKDYALSLDQYPQPYYMPYVLLSFQEAGYSIGNLNQYFNEPYATQIPGLYDGTKTGSEINGHLTKTSSDFYSNAFLSDYDNSNFDGLRLAFEENGINAWTCNTPLLLIHGDADVYVPSTTSETIYDGFVENNSLNVELRLLQGLDHTTAAIPSIELGLMFFKDL